MEKLEVLLSYFIEDDLWANQVIHYLQDHGCSLTLECLAKDEENYSFKFDFNRYAISIIIYSTAFLKNGYNLERHLVINKNENGVECESLRTLFDSTKVLLIRIDECTMNNHIINKNVKTLRWHPGNELKFWQKFGKIVASLKKLVLIKNVMASNSPMKECNESKDIFKDHSYIHKETIENIEDISNSWTYENYNKVYPHLLSSSFTAEDEDLTKSELENLAVKVEDIQTFLLLSTPTKKESSPVKLTSKFDKFSSSHDQMECLNVLQTVHDRLVKKIQYCNDVLRKRSYCRLLKRYDKCIALTVNGKKDQEELRALMGIFSGPVDTCQCCCCNILFHSERALQMHFTDCVRKHWIPFMK